MVRRGWWRVVGALLFILPCSLAVGSKHVVSLGAGSTEQEHLARARSLDSEARGNISALIARSVQGVVNQEVIDQDDEEAEHLVPFPLEGVPRQSRTDDGYKISPKPCEVSGIQGTCMFVWECLKTDGQHLGMCMDGFMFGSCCIHDTRDNDIASSNIYPSSSSSYSSSSSSYPSSSSSYSSSSSSYPQASNPYPSSHSSHSSHSSFYPASSYSSSDSSPPPTKPPYSPKTTPGFTSLSSGNTYFRPPRPKRPPRPSINRVGILSGMEEPAEDSYDMTRPPRPTKPSTLIWPSSPPRKPPTGRPQSWDKKDDTYFPENNHVEERDPVKNEPEDWGWSTKSTPTRPTRPPKPGGLLKYSAEQTGPFREASTSTTTTSTSTTTTTTSTTTTTTTSTTPTTTTTAPTTTTTEIALPVFQIPTTPAFSISSALTLRPSSAAVSAESSPRSSCGQPTMPDHCSEGRIVNGSRACYGQFPWQVSVRRTSFLNIFGSSTHRCGGALLNEYWVATAGHCVDDLTISQIRLRLGEWDFSSESEPNPHLEVKAIKKIVHPKYNFFTYENDLALVRAEKRIKFADNIIPICLPGNDDLLIGEFGTVAGWGRLSEKGVLPSILQHVSVPIVSNERCKSMFLAAGRHEVIPDIFMCAGYETGGRDSCQGDSGGPLVVKGKDGRWFLAGIISWGIGCAEPNLPGVCTRISQFRGWILENVK